MRIVLTLVAIELLSLPYLKIGSAALLVYIGADLLKGTEELSDGGLLVSGMLVAIRTILVADLVMSLDNVLAVAAAANGSRPLLILGLMVSIPLIIFGASLLSQVMERFPIIITVGAAMLGFLAGEMLLTDPVITAQFGVISEPVVILVGVTGALLVVGLGNVLKLRSKAHLG
jgi:YjbE family integral membrane protein